MSGRNESQGISNAKGGVIKRHNKAPQENCYHGSRTHESSDRRTIRKHARVGRVGTRNDHKNGAHKSVMMQGAQMTSQVRYNMSMSSMLCVSLKLVMKQNNKNS
jgi:hypothetical protein